MKKRMLRKIKNRIWLFSSIMLIFSVIAIINNPIIWINLLPIIVPSFTLTVSIPVYDISKYIKENKKLEIKSEISRDVLDQHSKDKNDCVSINNFSKNHDITYECYETTQEKNKVKTKGTIH